MIKFLVILKEASNLAKFVNYYFYYLSLLYSFIINLKNNLLNDLLINPIIDNQQFYHIWYI